MKLPELKKGIYISGPISGLPEDICKQKFENAENFLKKRFDNPIINPLKIAQGLKKNSINKGIMSDAEYLLEDLKYLSLCESIFMLYGWKKSEGAKIEYNFAKYMGINIFEFDDEECKQPIYFIKKHSYKNKKKDISEENG